MSFVENLVQETLELIYSSKLPYPSGPLLGSFVTEAVSPEQAALYLSERLHAGEYPSVLSDWIYIIECITQNGRMLRQLNTKTRSDITRRDGFRCCVTGKKGTFWDPLLVLPILPIPSGWDTEKGKIFDMLGAFFGPQYRDWWLSYVRGSGFVTAYQSHWLVRQSAAKALALGQVRLDRLQPSSIEYEARHVLIDPEVEVSLSIDGEYPLLGDHSRSGILKIDPRFVGTHARLCTSIQFLALTKKLAVDSLPRTSSSFTWQVTSQSQLQKRKHFNLIGCFTNAFLATWLIFPRKFRIFSYNFLRRVGHYMYGPPNSVSTVQRLPFGLYLKYHGERNMFRNEFNALQMVHKYTSIPAPIPLDIVSESERTDDLGLSPHTYLLLTRLPGLPLSRCQYVLSDRDCEQISNQMKDYLSEIRTCQDPRIYGGQCVGPFTDEAAFSQTLRYPDDAARRGHKIVFAHADLNPRNILVDKVIRADGSYGWVVTGIVDWATSGYYPDYWDYTKAMFEGFRWTRRYNDMLHKLFMEFGDYSKEFDVEKRSWESGDGV